MARWRAVEGYEGIYEVSDTGYVKRLERVSNGQTLKELIMKPQKSRNGYMRVGLVKDGYQTIALLHRVVAKAFIENTEGKPQINHKDGNKENNTVANLEWCTAKENIAHIYAELGGRKALKGVENPSNVYTEEEIIRVLHLRFNEKKLYREIADVTGMHKQYVGLICKGTRWAELYNKFNKGVYNG